jgi:hypothetical protein
MNQIDLLLIRGLVLVVSLVATVPGLAAQSAKSDPATGTLRGRIKEQKGRALEGVLIKATMTVKATNEGATAGRHYEVVSGGQGDFVLQNLAPGDYVLTFTKSGYKTFTTRPLGVAAGETIRLRSQIELTREDDPYAVIRGAILQGVGYSLPDATVILERIDGKKRLKMETVSREGGEFAFRFKADQARYRLTATASGFDATTIEIAIENDEVRNVALTLKPRQ